MSDKLTHFDKNGNAIMVDVSEKEDTARVAVATGYIQVSKEMLDHIENGTMGKGDVLGVSRVAGIMGVKHCSTLIPMCHTLLITKTAIDFEIDRKNLKIIVYCTAKTTGKTGVEMEALTGVSVALLTIYDMCKAVDKRMNMGGIHLVSKTGGKSGDFKYDTTQTKHNRS